MISLKLLDPMLNKRTYELGCHVHMIIVYPQNRGKKAKHQGHIQKVTLMQGMLEGSCKISRGGGDFTNNTSCSFMPFSTITPLFLKFYPLKHSLCWSRSSVSFNHFVSLSPPPCIWHYYNFCSSKVCLTLCLGTIREIGASEYGFIGIFAAQKSALLFVWLQ